MSSTSTERAPSIPERLTRLEEAGIYTIEQVWTAASKVPSLETVVHSAKAKADLIESQLEHTRKFAESGLNEQARAIARLKTEADKVVGLLDRITRLENALEMSQS